MSNRHEVRAYNYINRSYADVRRDLLAQPLDVFRRATAHSSGPELHASTGIIDLSAEIVIEILGVEEPSPQRANLNVMWKASRRPGLFR